MEFRFVQAKDCRTGKQKLGKDIIIPRMEQIFRLSLWVIQRRLRRVWGLSAVTATGILAAVVLLSATALYSQVLAEAGVRHTLFSESQSSLHVQVLAQNRPLGPEDYGELRSIAERTAQQRIGYLTVRQERFGRTQVGMPVTTNPERRAPPLSAPSGRPFFMTGFAEHSRIIEGSWPQGDGVAGPSGVELEAVVGRRVANDMGYEVGTRLHIIPFRTAPEQRIILNIVGVADPIDPRDQYWLGYPNQFSLQTVGEMMVVPAYVSEHDFLQVLGRRFPTAVGDFGFNFFVDPSVITAETVDATQEALDGLETDLNKAYPRTFVFSRLGLTLEEFKRDLTLARVPVYVFVSLVVVVILYFLALITGILGRTRADEIGLLLNRGASVTQVCGISLLVEGALALVAVATGPLLAWLIVRFLLLPTFGELEGSPIEIAVSGYVFWTGAVGAIVSVAVLAASTAGSALAGVADAQSSRSRPPAVSFFHRYYLDLLAVLVVGLVWWQFQQRDGFVSSALASRGLEVDPVLVLGPVLGLLAAALLLMRVLPWLVRVVVWLCMRAGPGWSSITLARLARDPVLPSSLAVLLMLTAALGVFGATFQSSLSRSQSDQAQYRVGGEVVVSGPGVKAELADDLVSIPGVAAATPVLRDLVSLTGGHSSTPARLIAAEPEAMAQSVWYRDDFSETTLTDLLSSIRTVPRAAEDSHLAVPLPTGADAIGVWLETGDLKDHELQADINVWARLADANGRYRNVSLGGFAGPSDTGAEGWRLLKGEMPDGSADASRQWFLAAITFSTSSFVAVPAGRVHMDDFTVFGSSFPEDGVVVESFNALGNWHPLETAGSLPDRLEISTSTARSGETSLAFSWQENFGERQRGIHLPPVSLPLPAIGGAGLYPGQIVRIKYSRASIPVEIVGVSDLFPTVTSFRNPFLILDINGYLSYLRFLPPGNAETSSQEIWLSLDSAQDPEIVIAQVEKELPPLASVADRRKVANAASRNPLAGGGWSGLTGMSMAGMGLVLLTALLLHSWASVRAVRVDTAVAKALGMSGRQLFLSLIAEKWLMGGVAIVAGAAIGYWPGLELVQLLDSTSNSMGPLPPMIPEVNIPLLASVLAGLAAAVMASAFLAAAMAQRSRAIDVLREGA